MTQLFLASAANIVMDDIVKHLPKKPTEYKVSFIPTAAEVEEGDLWWLRDDRNKLVEAGFQLTEFSITGLNKYQIEDKLKDIDLIFISGGNIFYLLDQCIKSEFDQVLREKINNGVIYIGSSAGSALVGIGNQLAKYLDDSTKAPGLKSDGLGIVDFVILPHWGSTDFHDGYQKSFADLYSENYKIIPLTNTQYLWVKDRQIEFIDVRK